MNFFRVFCASGLLLAWAATWTGCNQSSAVDTQQVEKYRTAFALEQEPDGAQTVLQIRESLAGESAHHEEGDAHDDHAGHDHDDPAHEDHAEDDHADHDHDAEPQGEAAATSDPAAGAEHDEDAHAHHEEGEADDDHDHGSAEAHHEDSHGEEDHAADDHAGHDHAAHDHDHAAHGPTEARDVVMVGMVGGLPNAATQTLPEFPFVKDYAIVMIADPLAVVELEEGGHDHAPGEECPFCAAHAGDQSSFLATVRFTDDGGNVLSVDTRQLFDLKVKDVVVVRGKARLDHDGTLVVDATGLFVRR